MEQLPLRQILTDIVLKHVASTGESDRSFAKRAGISHTLLGKMRGGTAMGLDVLEKIINSNQNLIPEIGAVFISTDIKKSAIPESTEAALLKEAMQELREQLAFLRSQNTDLTKALLKSKMVEEG